MVKIHSKNGGKGDQSQLIFMSYYNIILMLYVSISVHKTVSGKLRIPKKTCQVNYIKPLFMSMYI